MADTMTADQIREMAQQRVEELRPVVEAQTRELHELEKMLKTEVGNGGSTTPRRGGGRRREGEKVEDRFLALVREQPGISVSEAARTLKMHANYLYRISADLKSRGVIRKEDKGYVPVETATEGE